MPERPRILFMGTTRFAVAVLEAVLEAGYRVAGVVTQPDRETGRNRILTPPPVKIAARECGLPVLQPARVGSADSLAACAALSPDLIVTAAYGQLLPDRLLALPRLGAYNVHASLLPKYRGGAPIQWAIIRGERETGVSIMTMVKMMDAGPVWSQTRVPIGPDMTFGELHDILARAGGRLLVETLPGILDGTLVAQPQDETQATYAPAIRREDERIDFHLDARAVHDRIRALAPAPGGFARWGDTILKIWADAPDETRVHQAKPGTCIELAAEGPVIACGRGAVALTRVQVAGRRAISGAEFVRSLPSADVLVLGADETGHTAPGVS